MYVPICSSCPFSSDAASSLRLASTLILGLLIHLPVRTPAIEGRSRSTKQGKEKPPLSAERSEQHLAGVRHSAGRVLGSREPRTKQAKNSLP